MLKLSVFHNLPSGGALRALRDKLFLFKSRGWKINLYTFETAERGLFPLDEAADQGRIYPLRFRGIRDYGAYRAVSEAAARAINADDSELVWVEKCRFFGAPPMLQHLQKKHILYLNEPLRYQEYERLVSGSAPKAPAPFDFPAKITRIPLHVLVKAQDRKTVRRAGLVMTNSHFTAGWLKKAYGVEAAVHYQGVDSGFFVPSASKPSGEPFVLSVGRIDRTKAHDFIVDVLSGISPAARPKLVVVCDSIEEPVKCRLIEQAKRLGVVCDIQYRISSDELRTLYQAAQMVLCGAHHEPFGLVPLEAMACGTPVMAVREGGFQETILDGHTGFLLERDSRVWARKLESCLKDKIRLEQLGANGRRHAVSRWSWDLFVDGVEQTVETHFNGLAAFNVHETALGLGKS